VSIQCSEAVQGSLELVQVLLQKQGFIFSGCILPLAFVIFAEHPVCLKAWKKGHLPPISVMDVQMEVAIY